LDYARAPAHQDVEIAKSDVPHPLREGFKTRIGDPKGQNADYGMCLPDGKGIHIREYQDKYLVHWDKVDPPRDPIGHLVNDAPHWIAIGGLVGALTLAAALFLTGED
jgi:hypothetical protein